MMPSRKSTANDADQSPSAQVLPFPTKPVEPKPKPRAEARALLEAALGTGVRGSVRDAIQASLEALDANPRRQITNEEYQALKPGQKLVDPRRRGFLARCSTSGVRFLYRHRDPVTNKQVETLIGYQGAIALADARKQWETMRARRMGGLSPVEDVKSPESALPTMRELATLYLDRYCAKVKRSWNEDRRLLDRHVLPSYGDAPVDQFTTTVARRLFASLDDTPRERDKLRASMSTMFNVAIGKTKKLTIADTWLPENFPNPITNAQTAAHESMGRHEPSMVEARRYLAGLRAGVLRKDYSQALELQLLLACRIAEVTGMAWDELDLDTGQWTLPAERSKNGHAYLIFLSPRAREIIAERAAIRAGGDHHVFPMLTDRSRPLRADLVSQALKARRAELGVAGKFTSHSVRVAFSTWAGRRQISQELIHRCTAHVLTNDRIAATYNRATLDEPAAVLWAEWAEALES